MNGGGFAGTIILGWLLGRFRIERLMGVNYAAAAVCIGLLALVAGSGCRWGYSRPLPGSVSWAGSWERMPC